MKNATNCMEECGNCTTAKVSRLLRASYAFSRLQLTVHVLVCRSTFEKLELEQHWLACTLIFDVASISIFFLSITQCIHPETWKNRDHFDALQWCAYSIFEVSAESFGNYRFHRKKSPVLLRGAKPSRQSFNWCAMDWMQFVIVAAYSLPAIFPLVMILFIPNGFVYLPRISQYGATAFEQSPGLTHKSCTAKLIQGHLVTPKQSENSWKYV